MTLGAGGSTRMLVSPQLGSVGSTRKCVYMNDGGLPSARDPFDRNVNGPPSTLGPFNIILLARPSDRSPFNTTFIVSSSDPGWFDIPTIHSACIQSPVDTRFAPSSRTARRTEPRPDTGGSAHRRPCARASGRASAQNAAAPPVTSKPPFAGETLDT